MKKLRYWSCANAVMAKNEEKKENGGMGIKEKNRIHKEKSQACCPLRRVLHSPQECSLRLMKSGKLSLELNQSPSCPTAPFLPFPSPLQNAFILFVSCCPLGAHLFQTLLWFLNTFLYPSIWARCVDVCVTLYRGKVKEHIHYEDSIQTHTVKYHIIHTNGTNGSTGKTNDFSIVQPLCLFSEKLRPIHSNSVDI